MTVEEITPLSSDRHVRLSLIKDGKRFSAIWFGIGAGGLGFVEGNEIHVVSSSGANIIVTVLGARFGIDSKVAMHIMTVG